jgi:hypothetical protein
MAPVRTPLAAALVLCLVAAGCKREHPYPVERVDVGAWGALPRAGLGVTRAEVEAAVTSRLAAAGFRLVDAERGEEVPEGAIRLSLDLPLVQGAPAARVGALLQVRRRSGAAPVRYESEGLGEAPPGERGEDAKRRLEELGLKVRLIDVPGGPERVLRTDPNGGAQVKRGSTVTVYTF